MIILRCIRASEVPPKAEQPGRLGTTAMKPSSSSLPRVLQFTGRG
jgi:hypothetical protein